MSNISLNTQAEGISYYFSAIGNFISETASKVKEFTIVLFQKLGYLFMTSGEYLWSGIKIGYKYAIDCGKFIGGKIAPIATIVYDNCSKAILATKDYIGTNPQLFIGVGAGLLAGGLIATLIGRCCCHKKTI